MEVFAQLALALGLGLLVGLQRQRSAEPLAGIRTFPLITVLGTVAALLSQSFGGWVLGLGLVALAGLALIANLALLKHREGPVDPGLTTEVAMLVMYAVGAYLVVGQKEVAIAVGGGVAVLLQLKEPLHRLANRIGDNDFRAIIQFALISLVILPVLPDRTFGPYGVLNLRQIWLMVVLIVGISLAGYLAYKLFGTKAGTLLAGVLGGLISSTATTVSQARRSRSAKGLHRQATVVILIASAIVFVRVLVEMAVVAPEVMPVAGVPIALMLGGMILLAVVAWLGGHPGGGEMGEHDNPSELRSALVFGAVYALVLLAVAAVKENFGANALYGVAVLSGLTDMDAITLSTAQLMRSGQLAATVGWRLILVASMANLIFKLAVVAVLGDRRLTARLAGFFAAALALGGGLLLFWPQGGLASDGR